MTKTLTGFDVMVCLKMS